MLDLFTTVWGAAERHRGLIELYRDVTIPSLMQPNNIPAASKLIGSYNIYADGAAMAALNNSPLFQQMQQLCDTHLRPLQKGVGDTSGNIMFQMSLSAAAGNHMLIVSPDWTIGDGSILNMAKLCSQGQYSLILYGFPKLDPKAFDEMRATFRSGESISNRSLVSIAVRFGGVKIQPNARDGPVTGILAELETETYSVYHRCPTPCLIPDQKIINFFLSNPTPNQGYDHALPMWMIENGYPWYFIDHSDTFFVVEEAEAWRGGSGPWGLDWLEKADVFFSQFQQIWRAA